MSRLLLRRPWRRRRRLLRLRWLRRLRWLWRLREATAAVVGVERRARLLHRYCPPSARPRYPRCRSRAPAGALPPTASARARPRRLPHGRGQGAPLCAAARRLQPLARRARRRRAALRRGSGPRRAGAAARLPLRLRPGLCGPLGRLLRRGRRRRALPARPQPAGRLDARVGRRRPGARARRGVRRGRGRGVRGGRAGSAKYIKTILRSG